MLCCNLLKRKNQLAIVLVSFGICDDFENQLEGKYVNSPRVGEEDIREYLKIICGNGFFRERERESCFETLQTTLH